ncbi:hypothetical protein ACQPZ2_04220 [Nocardia pseudovaccinii]|uniref:hypothetical protein n=1 Tax=Nocardia pseudovaccinii TaxID=189540 RepID=UPI003D93F1CB
MTSTAAEPAAMANRFDWSIIHADDTLVVTFGAERAGIELPAPLRIGVELFFQDNGLSGPTIAIGGPVGRHIRLVTGISKADRAIEYLQHCGAVLHVGRAVWPLPPVSGLGFAWSADGGHGHRIPPLVAVAAAVRAVRLYTPDGLEQFPGQSHQVTGSSWTP